MTIINKITTKFDEYGKRHTKVDFCTIQETFENCTNKSQVIKAIKENNIQVNCILQVLFLDNKCMFLEGFKNEKSFIIDV